MSDEFSLNLSNFGVRNNQNGQKRAEKENISDAERPLSANHIQRFDDSNGLEHQTNANKSGDAW